MTVLRRVLVEDFSGTRKFPLGRAHLGPNKALSKELLEKQIPGDNEIMSVSVRRVVIAAKPESSWWQDAECRGVDPEVFHPDPEIKGSDAEAKTICASCPAIEPCLEYALSVREKQGIWGGLTEIERRRMVRRRRRAAQRV